MIRQSSGWIKSIRFIAGVMLLLFIWLGLLPRIGALQPVSRMIDHHQESGIDPSAMFYTELEHLEYRDGMLRKRTRNPSERVIKNP